MKIHATPSTAIFVDGRTYRIYPTVYNVMCTMDALEDEHLLPGDRMRLAVEMLFGRRNPKDTQAALDAVFNAINEPNPYKVKDKGVRALDYEQDANLIIAAFRQLYDIDLQREAMRMDWRMFRALMSGVTADTALGQIMDIRTRDLPESNTHNNKQRRELMRMKAEYAVRPRAGITTQNYEDGLKKFALALMQMAGDNDAGRKGNNRRRTERLNDTGSSKPSKTKNQQSIG